MTSVLSPHYQQFPPRITLRRTTARLRKIVLTEHWSVNTKGMFSMIFKISFFNVFKKTSIYRVVQRKVDDRVCSLIYSFALSIYNRQFFFNKHFFKLIGKKFQFSEFCESGIFDRLTGGIIEVKGGRLAFY